MSSTIAGTVTSAVTIGTGTYTSPLTISAGATVTISGAGSAVSSPSLATVVDDGTVSATSSGGAGIVLDAGGYVSLGGAGLVSAYAVGVEIGGTLGTVTNAGTISAGGTSGIGVDLAAGGTVVDSGVITSAATAIVFGGTGTNLLELQAGYSITGSVAGSGSATNLLELASAAGAGTVSGIGTKFSGFETVTVDSGAQWSLSGVNQIGSGVSLDNLGSLDGEVTLTTGGYFDNEVSGSILVTAGKSVAAYGTGGFVSVTNAGLIEVTGTAGIAVFLRAGGTVANSGSIEATGTFYSNGILLGGTGGVNNSSSTALIEGYTYGIKAPNAGDTVTNAGTIRATATSGGVAVDFGAGGTVSDSGTIVGTTAIAFGGAGSVSVGTAGLVDGSHVGVEAVGAAATVTNAGIIEATLASDIGVDLAAGGTIVDSGAISGSTAIHLGGSLSNLLELEHGFSLSGSIIGSGSAANTLELSGTLGGVTVNYNGLSLVDFGFVDFAAPTGGHDETLVIGNTASLPGTIEGFTAVHDIIDLTSFTYHAGASVTEGSDDKLTIVSGAETLTVQLAGSYSSVQWIATPDSGTGTDIEPACFARGTLILTEYGERPVEGLQIGDRVVTHSGGKRPIKWIGRRSYRGAFLLRNSDMWPIRVRAGALGPDTPRRDLYLSARHALFLDGLLIPAECLVNGSSIVRCDCPEEIEYFHIELASHDVILAEGAPAETFVDCDSRGIFHNAHEFALLYPGEEPLRWAFCAPRVAAGRALERTRRRLLRRAGRRAA